METLLTFQRSFPVTNTAICFYGDPCFTKNINCVSLLCSRRNYEKLPRTGQRRTPCASLVGRAVYLSRVQFAGTCRKMASATKPLEADPKVDFYALLGVSLPLAKRIRKNVRQSTYMVCIALGFDQRTQAVSY